MDEIEHNRLAREAALMGVNGFTTSTNQSVSQGKTHMCNCIGCCKKCGMCSTHPRHTAQVCYHLRLNDEQRAKIIWGD